MDIEVLALALLIPVRFHVRALGRRDLLVVHEVNCCKEVGDRVQWYEKLVLVVRILEAATDVLVPKCAST